MAATTCDLPVPALAEDQKIGAVVDPFLAGREGQDMRFTKSGGGVEVEVGEAFAGGKTGLRAMTLNAPGGSVSYFQFDQGGEQLGGRPSFPVGDFGEAFPMPSDAGETERGEQGWQDGGVRVIAGHA